MIFRTNVSQLKTTTKNYFYLFSSLFFRLKNLVYEDLPKLKIIKYKLSDDIKNEHFLKDDFHKTCKIY